jgi:hypothetical protein
MAYVPSAIAPQELPGREAPATRPVGRGLLRRLFDAAIAARQRQVEREIAYYLRDTGGIFNDEVEREVERRFLS